MADDSTPEATLLRLERALARLEAATAARGASDLPQRHAALIERTQAALDGLDQLLAQAERP